MPEERARANSIAVLRRCLAKLTPRRRKARVRDAAADVRRLSLELFEAIDMLAKESGPWNQWDLVLANDHHDEPTAYVMFLDVGDRSGPDRRVRCQLNWKVF